jgi:endonuclease YncB( thermonuclease family)
MIRSLLIALLVILATASVDAAELTGRVVAVTDGDTLTLLTSERRRLTIRLVEIDAPEGGQPWGQRSKQQLSELVASRQVRVVENGKDQYGRTLGRIYVGDVDVNAEMVRTGSAWAYREYLVDRNLPPVTAARWPTFASRLSSPIRTTVKRHPVRATTCTSSAWVLPSVMRSTSRACVWVATPIKARPISVPPAGALRRSTSREK